MDWWKCRSRSPLLNPSKICKNHGRNWERGKLSKMEEREGENVLGKAEWLKVGGGVFIPLPEKEPLQPLSPEFPVWEAGDSGPGGDSGPKGRRLRTQKVRKKPMQKNSYRRLRGYSGPTPDPYTASAALWSSSQQNSTGRRLRPLSPKRPETPDRKSDTEQQILKCNNFCKEAPNEMKPTRLER